MKKLHKFWPLFFIFVVWVILFWPFFSKRLLPMPNDIIVGLYYPWLDYKWGYAVGVPVKNPLLSDVPSIIYPWRSFVVDEIKAGRWPLWNPYYFAGMPLLANFQSAVFSYVNIFFLFFSKPIAWSLGIMAFPLLTMMMMFLFLRHKKLSKLPSLLGAIVFSLSGFEIAWLEYNVHGHTALFLPLLLFTIDKICGEKKKIWLFLLPILVAFQVFSGYIPIVIYTCMICFIYVGYFYLLPELRERKFDFKKYALLGLFWVGGILLALIQLLPGWELAKNSIRLTDPTVEASNASYLPLANLITLLAPDFFGNPATGNYFGKAFYDNFYFFVGTGTLILILYSLFSLRKGRDIRFWLGLLVFSFVLVFKNPLGIFLEKIFFLSGGVASKALFITDFSLAILAGFGMERFIKEGLNHKKKIYIVIFLVIVIFLFSVTASFQIKVPINRLVAQRNLVIPGLFLFLSSLTLILILCLLPRLTGLNLVDGAGILLVILVSLQLLYSAKKYLPFSKEGFLFPKTPVIDFLLEQKTNSKEPFRVEINDVIPQNFLMPYGIETTSGYDALLPKRMGEFLSLLETGEIKERISRVQLIKNYDSPLFPLLNTKYILAKKMTDKGIFSPEGNPPGRFKDRRYKLVFEDKTVQVYEDLKYLPRAFWVYESEVIGDVSGLAERLKLIDIKKRIILEEEEGIEDSTKPTFGKIEWLKYQPGEIVLSVSSDQTGYVFIANNFYPGWRAYIDNQETKIYRANFTFQAVKIEEGNHLLTLRYKPDHF